jgi:hypothetical protein
MYLLSAGEEGWVAALLVLSRGTLLWKRKG